MLRVPHFNVVALSRGSRWVCYTYKRAGTVRDQRFGDNPSRKPAGDTSSPTRRLSFKLDARVRRLAKTKLNQLCQCLNALSAAWISAFPCSQYGLEANFANCEAIHPLLKIHRWIIVEFLNEKQAMINGLKSFSAWLRYCIAADAQLWPAPERNYQFPMFNEQGKLDLSKVFKGSFSRYSKSTIARLCRFARALPPGDREQCSRSLVVHRDTLQIERVTDKRVLRTMRLATDCRFENIKCSIDIDVKKVSLSSSASFSHSRRCGGAMQELKVQLWTRHPEFASKDPWDPEYITWMHYEGRPEEWNIVHTHAWLSCVEDQTLSIPKHRVVAIPDRGGFKTRVVTAGLGTTQTLAHNVRKPLYSKVLSRTAVKFALRTGGVEEFFDSLPVLSEYSRGFGDVVLLSSDLKSATDLFPFDLVHAVNDSLQSVFKFSPQNPNWMAWRRLSGPQELHYRINDVDEVLVSKSGNLMGTAPSWFHLCMFNLNCFDVAWWLWWSFVRLVNTDKVGTKTRRRFNRLARLFRQCRTDRLDWEGLTKEVLLLLESNTYQKIDSLAYRKFARSLIVIGDDLGAVCPFAVAVLYEVFVRLCGGSTSPGKHYVLSAVEGSFMLIAEEVAVVKNGRLTFVKTDSVRAFANLRDYTVEKFSTGSPRNQASFPAAPWALMGNVLRSVSDRARPESRKALLSFAHTATCDTRSSLLRAGLPVYIPVILGGLGWPHPKGDDVGFARSNYIHLRLIQCIKGFRENFFDYHLKYAQVRALWRGDQVINLFGPVAAMFRDYLSSRISVSRDANGRIAALTEEHQVGLFNPELPSIPFSDLLDRISQGAMVARFLVSGVDYMVNPDLGVILENDVPTVEITDGISIPISKAAKAYKTFCNRLYEERRGHLKSQEFSNLSRLVEEETDYMSSFHILWNDEFRRSLDDLFFQDTVGLGPGVEG